MDRASRPTGRCDSVFRLTVQVPRNVSGVAAIGLYYAIIVLRGATVAKRLEYCADRAHSIAGRASVTALESGRLRPPTSCVTRLQL